jgi:membrane fusion protein (multidrug efflux system)
LIELAQQTVKLKQSDVDRKSALLARSAGSQVDTDTSIAALVNARTQAEQLIQQRASLRNQLLADPNLPIEKYPAYMQATAAVDQARRDLEHTVVRAPIAGTATQVPSIQLGRYVAAGTPVFAIMDDDHPWVDANPKETDVTYLRVGQPVSIKADTFPDQTFAGTVSAVSPGTGAQFAILPPQNASGNWVKVVQRLPIRIEFAPGQDTDKLRAGMSVTVDVDTGRQRSLATLFGFAATAKGPSQ